MTLYALDGVAPSLPEDGDVWVAPDANIIGHIILEDEANIWFGATLRGDNEPIVIGAPVPCQALSTIGASQPCLPIAPPPHQPKAKQATAVSAATATSAAAATSGAPATSAAVPSEATPVDNPAASSAPTPQ